MKEESLLLLSDLQKLINQVVLIDYTIIILGSDNMKHILIVEDDNLLNKTLTYNLELDGYTITSVLNASSCISPKS